jgi:hypothetical protein
MNPLSDFKSLGINCTINDAQFYERQDFERDGAKTRYKCFNGQRYSFKIRSSIATHVTGNYETEEWSSATRCWADAPSEDLRRSVARGDFKDTPMFTIGQIVECWEPTSLPVNNLYKCGNTTCIKVVDPQTDKNAAGDEAGSFTAAGVAMLVCAGIMSIVYLVYNHVFGTTKEKAQTKTAPEETPEPVGA